MEKEEGKKKAVSKNETASFKHKQYFY